ncbi:MAG: cupin domain-containing protein [Burkholderiales bacterium]|nr:cupin domain-containing protein [Burkholderiales bacterium]
MPFYRFEQFQSRLLTPHLSSGAAPVIEGRYMSFCLLHKEAGTGSELHYHPNELLIFPIRGKINAIVGTDRRIVAPGTFVHCPAYARHSMKAAEDGPVDYLYIKDMIDGERKRCGPGDIAHLPRGGTWTLVASAPATRYAAVRSTAWLERKIDTISPEEQARARVERKAN